MRLWMDFSLVRPAAAWVPFGPDSAERTSLHFSELLTSRRRPVRHAIIRVLAGDKQRAVGQFEGFPVSITVVNKKPVVLGRRNPGLAAVAAEDRPQSAVARSVGSMQRDERAVAQRVEAVFRIGRL